MRGEEMIDLAEMGSKVLNLNWVSKNLLKSGFWSDFTCIMLDRLDFWWLEIHCGECVEEMMELRIGLILYIFSATTHTDLILRGRERGVEMKVIHNVSGEDEDLCEYIC